MIKNKEQRWHKPDNKQSKLTLLIRGLSYLAKALSEEPGLQGSPKYQSPPEILRATLFQKADDTADNTCF